MSLTKVYVALDTDSLSQAQQWATQLQGLGVGLKVGKEFFTYYGPEPIREWIKQGFSIFLDLKFHDIPNTVAKAVTAAAELGVDIVNVHASGGSAMMTAAKQALQPYGKNAPKLIAVTVLTSSSDDDLRELGINLAVAEQVMALTELTHKAGLDGVVCSALEAQALKQRFGKDFLLVTPGIRPQGTSNDDQKRVVTPEQALSWGVDAMVIGRPITQAPNPRESAEQILASIE
ncbi:orotidine-5'-phosphate decarboxylase [Idiomarina tyrosinivorans]|uniref:Orotidine 5'-phosphate decarboxylase n=1 Tax=Idiomarina tyrosinivorans TaxID=1445662 RepID=A0A432ZTU8_9GAMM|nr:orotidine-5'-phosphate decarboxylase [Idiomarina tyrosinivorans]RUO81365.1 orotidine-5'-phosphate decarboxylase [Idiomarina tyrosinivorans]